jgi:hypothetical protein
LALDTGATKSLINEAMLIAVGYDPALAVGGRVQVTTGSGIEYLPQIRLLSLAALGLKRADFPVLSHTLPPTTGVDGLDFLKNERVLIDLSGGEWEIR